MPKSTICTRKYHKLWMPSNIWYIFCLKSLLMNWSWNISCREVAHPVFECFLRSQATSSFTTELIFICTKTWFNNDSTCSKQQVVCASFYMHLRTEQHQNIEFSTAMNLPVNPIKLYDKQIFIVLESLPCNKLV